MHIKGAHCIKKIIELGLQSNVNTIKNNISNRSYTVGDGEDGENIIVPQTTRYRQILSLFGATSSENKD